MKFAGASSDFTTILIQTLLSALGYFIVIGITSVLGKNFLYLPLVLGPFIMVWQLVVYDYNKYAVDTLILSDVVQIGFIYLYYRKFVELSAKNNSQIGAGRKR